MAEGRGYYLNGVWVSREEPAIEIPDDVVTLEDAVAILRMACSKRFDSPYSTRRYEEAFVEAYYEYKGETEGEEALRFANEVPALSVPESSGSVNPES